MVPGNTTEKHLKFLQLRPPGPEHAIGLLEALMESYNWAYWSY
jgi:hypothetical protein